MIDPVQFDLLCSDGLRSAIADNLGRDPAEVALDKRTPHAALVATQVKYLARAAEKLPSYAAARCILPPRAFEQASSEACAAHKRIEGDAVLDLTCGLGVDALALSRHFRRVVAVERDPVLAKVAAWNFRLLGADRIEVVCADAADYLASCRGRFDWVYADPDRRDAAGRKMVRLEECSPDILALRPAIARVSERLCLKNSPLFDVDEAFRLFGSCRTEAVSLGGECKEVMIYADGTGPLLTATALGRGSVSCTPDEAREAPAAGRFDPGAYRWLVATDAALRKARLARYHLQGRADLFSDTGYAFAAEHPGEVLGKVFAIERIEPYEPRRLRRELKGRGIEILKRDFPPAAAAIAARLGVREGADERIAFTKIGDRYWTIRLKPLILESRSDHDR